jgi:hypothetical protein
MNFFTTECILAEPRFKRNLLNQFAKKQHCPYGNSEPCAFGKVELIKMHHKNDMVAFLAHEST